MNRRRLLTGAAAIGALSGVAREGRAQGVPITPPGPSLAQFASAKVSAADTWFPIGFRGRGPQGGGTVFDTTSTSIMDRQAWQAPSWCGVSTVRLVYAGFDMQVYGETSRAVTATLTAAVFIDTPASLFTVPSASAALGATSFSIAAASAAGVNIGMRMSGAGFVTGTQITALTPVCDASNNLTSVTVTIDTPLSAGITTATSIGFIGLIVPVTFNGSRTAVLTPRHGYLVSDPIGISLAAGQLFYSNTFATFSGSGFMLQDVNGIKLANEGCTRGSPTDQTLTTTVPTHTGGGFWGPTAVLAQLPTPKSSVLVLGDSIAAGYGDTLLPDTNGRVGFVQRSLGNDIPWLTLARSGQLAATNSKRFPGTLAALGLAKFTDVIVEFCRNDINSSFTVAVVKAAVLAMAQPFLDAGKRVWVCTACPTTTSTDGWTTLGNQTISSAGEANRLLYNTDIRANWASYGYAGLIDIALVVEEPTAPGKWKVSGGVWTGDGVHPAAFGVLQVVAAGILTPAMFPLP